MSIGLMKPIAADRDLLWIPSPIGFVYIRDPEWFEQSLIGIFTGAHPVDFSRIDDNK